jgi:hypothetical protein
MKKSSLLPCLLLSVATLPAQTLIVDGFGAGGWKSWDSRSSAGVHLFGTELTHAGWFEGGTAVGADDVIITSQIRFLAEGAVAPTAAGIMPDAAPVGSLDGLGYVRLDGTGANAGKSDLSYVDLGGIAAASTLLEGSFATTYRYYSDSSVSGRRPGLNIELTGTNDHGYVLVYVGPDPFTAETWHTTTADGASQFYLYGGGGTPNGTITHTLAEWALDPTWGSLLFGDGSDIFRVGFNVGSSQQGGLAYMDWVQTSLLNEGNLVDFQVSAIPEPGVTALGAGLLAAVAILPAGVRRRLLQRHAP